MWQLCEICGYSRFHAGELAETEASGPTGSLYLIPVDPELVFDNCPECGAADPSWTEEEPEPFVPFCPYCGAKLVDSEEDLMTIDEHQDATDCRPTDTTMRILQQLEARGATLGHDVRILTLAYAPKIPTVLFCSRCDLRTEVYVGSTGNWRKTGRSLEHRCSGDAE